MLALILLAAFALALWFWVWRWRSRLHAPFLSVPGPPALPLLGNTFQIVSKSSTELFHWMLELEKSYGKVYKVDGIYEYVLFYAAAEHVEKIMTCAEFNCKGDDYNVLLEWLGTGLLTSNGNKWFTHRKALTSAFHFKILDNFVPVFDRKSSILVKKLLENVGDTVEIFPLVKLYTLDVIIETAMGTASEAQTKQSKYTLAVEEIAAIAFFRMFNRIFYSDFVFQFSKLYEPYKRCLRTIHDFTLSVIEKRRQTLLLSSTAASDRPDIQVQDDRELGSRTKKALLDILLQTNIDGRPLTNEEVREEVDTFMFAGHDTTASAITFILYALAKHPEIQEKVYEEIVFNIGTDKDAPVNISSLNDLKYLDLVIKESLRKYPPVPFISRTAIKEANLGGVILPANTNITIGIYNMHHNAEYFPDPEQLIPERFETERGAEKLNPYAYVPFSAGSRNCIGQKFAQYEIKSTISKVIRCCRVQLPFASYEPPLKAEMILKPMDDMPLRFYPR
ncbi:probable cytochrome P450 4d14 [Malaya genurostris]|uniref:probable cytochrome P450 4d14 n=1 Tax=Malaya genurostris TaxID=325434 RepID=UPI0026F3999E|nr:probable cytochrome P450 4d14 [Malaya genurostris]